MSKRKLTKEQKQRLVEKLKREVKERHRLFWEGMKDFYIAEQGTDLQKIACLLPHIKAIESIAEESK